MSVRESLGLISKEEWKKWTTFARSIGKESKKFKNVTFMRPGKEPDHGKLAWMGVSPGYVYISFSDSRRYVVFSNCPLDVRPVIKATKDRDGNSILHVGTCRVRFTREADFRWCYRRLAPFSHNLTLPEAKKLLATLPR